MRTVKRRRSLGQSCVHHSLSVHCAVLQSGWATCSSKSSSALHCVRRSWSCPPRRLAACKPVPSSTLRLHASAQHRRSMAPKGLAYGIACEESTLHDCAHLTAPCTRVPMPVWRLVCMPPPHAPKVLQDVCNCMQDETAKDQPEATLFERPFIRSQYEPASATAPRPHTASQAGSLQCEHDDLHGL